MILQWEDHSQGVDLIVEAVDMLEAHQGAVEAVQVDLKGFAFTLGI